MAQISFFKDYGTLAPLYEQRPTLLNMVVTAWPRPPSDGTQVSSFAEPHQFYQIVWDTKDRFLAFLDGDSKLIIWNPRTSNENYIKIPLSGYPMSLALTTDGKLLAVQHDKQVTVYDIKDN